MRRLISFGNRQAVGMPPVRPNHATEDTVAREAELLQQIKNLKPEELEFPPGTAADLIDLIRQLMHTDPTKRLGHDIAALKSHAFFGDHIDWQQFNSLKGLPREMAPKWLRRTILEDPRVDERTKNYRIMPVLYKYAVQAEVISARNIAPPARPIYFTIQLDQRTAQRSNFKESLMPEWNEKFKFDVRDLNTTSDIIIKLVQEEKATVKGQPDTRNELGTVVVPLQDVKAITPDTYDVWTSIISESGLPVGELHVRFTWESTRHDLPQPIYVGQHHTKPFF